MRKAALMLATVVALLVAGGLVFLRPHPVVNTVGISVTEADEAHLATFARQRVFFAHQSVGHNILGGVPGVFAEQEASAPTIVTLGDQADSGAALIETEIGTNGDPLGKIRAFDQALRSGLADDLDAAILKLCFLDVTSATDVEELFAAYSSTIAALEADFPDVSFFHTTAPLLTDQDLIDRVKIIVGRGHDLLPEHNAARHRYNELIRAEYGSSGRLLDIAAIQASDASGLLQTREADGQPYQAMDPQWASDPGHLNPDGAARLANAFVALIADSQA